MNELIAVYCASFFINLLGLYVGYFNKNEPTEEYDAFLFIIFFIPIISTVSALIFVFDACANYLKNRKWQWDMTLRTVTYDETTHKIVSINATEEVIQHMCLKQQEGKFQTYKSWPRAWIVRERSKRTGLISNEILVENKNHFRESENYKYEFTE